MWNYITRLSGNPRLEGFKEVKMSEENSIKGEKDEGGDIETYEIELEGVKTEVHVVRKEYVPTYSLAIPDVDVATLALLDDIKGKLVGAVEVNSTDALDSKIMNELKKQFTEDAQILLEEELPHLDKKAKNYFTVAMLNDLLGLGDIEFLLSDDQIEEIVVNSAREPIRVFHKKYGWMKTNLAVDSEVEIFNYANIIARRVGRGITTLEPLLDAHLISKDRANAVLAPISTKGNTITIRKFARDPWTATDFLSNKTSSSEVLALIWLIIQYEMNMLISGGTGSGKTSFLNVCMPFVPPNHRIISIEDTRELQLPEFLYWCPLTTRQPNPEGKGEVSMLDLAVNSLRMRPDRIIMGEIRKQREAEVLFEAMHTGHSVYGTLHADTCEQTITRLTNPPVNIPHSMLDAVNLNVVMFRDRRKGFRRSSEVGEYVVDKSRRDEIRYKPKLLYKWNPRDDVIEPLFKNNTEVHLFEKIRSQTGLNMEEIEQDLATKKKILEWMVKHKVRNISDVGKVMNRYYVTQDTLVDVVEKDQDPSKILE